MLKPVAYIVVKHTSHNGSVENKMILLFYVAEDGDPTDVVEVRVVYSLVDLKKMLAENDQELKLELLFQSGSASFTLQEVYEMTIRDNDLPLDSPSRLTLIDGPVVPVLMASLGLMAESAAEQNGSDNGVPDPVKPKGLIN